MNEPNGSKEDFGRQIEEKARRKLAGRQKEERSLWLGLGAFGMVGWSIGVPTLLGALLGTWIDATWPGPISWRLTLLVGGLLIGCFNAWRWVTQEADEIRRDRERRAKSIRIRRKEEK